MAEKIIDVKVNDEHFKSFWEIYRKYHAALLDAPAEWKATETAVSGVAGEIGLMTAALLAQNELMGKKAKNLDAVSKTEIEQTRAAKKTQDAEKAAQERKIANLKKTLTLTKNIAGTVLGTIAAAAKYGIEGVGLGLLGGGGLFFGMDRLADAVSGQRFAAQGLGISTAQSSAFNLNYGRFVGDGNSFLQGIQNTKTDLNSRWALANLTGLDFNQIDATDNATLGIDVVKAAKRLWMSTPAAARNQQTMDADGLSKVMDFATWQRIGQTPDALLNQASAGYKTDTKALSVDPKIQEAWQNFSIQMQTAGANIEVALEKALIPLGIPLTNLSKSLVAAIDSLANNPNFAKDIEAFGTGIQRLATYLGSPQFLKDMQTFANDISAIASYIANSWVVQQMLGIKPQPVGGMHPTTSQGWTADVTYYPGLNPPFKPPGGVAGNYDFRRVASRFNLPPQLFSAVAMQESGATSHPNDSVVNGLHYQGMFQEGTAYQQQYGVTDPYNPGQEAYAFGAGMTDLLKRYHGNLAEALASYGGDTELNDQIKKYGAKWGQHANLATQTYVSQVAARMGIKIDLTNGTGSNVAVIANAISVPQ